MPYIDTKVSVSISKEKEEKIKARLGDAVSILGKGETYLMVGFQDNYRLYFAGKNDKPLAFVEVKLLGKCSREQYVRMTGEICNILKEELGIPGDGVYVKYEEVTHWGFNGSNF
ncbi:MAG: hypothetical protein J1F64_08005 [Oscillospiraceae bacterium]|nr:hypothetical protein [Oscillospiraceae bacterium]